MALYQRLWGPGCGMVHRSGSLSRPRQSVAPCQAAAGRRRKASDPEPEPEPESKAETPPARRGRPRKSTTGAGPAEAAAGGGGPPPPPPPPPPPAGPEEDAPVAAPTSAKRGRKPRASAAAPPTRPAAGPDLSEPAAAAAADAPAPEAPRRGRGRKASTAAAPAAAAAPSSSSSSSSDAGAAPAPAPAPSSTAPSSTGTPGSSLLDPLAFGGPPTSDGVFFFEGGNVTASQELDAMEDDVPSRLHLGFGDPMHSTDDLTFHHEQELLPARAGAGAARGRPAAAEAGGMYGAAAAEEDGWAKWRKFKAGTLPPEEMEYYRTLQEIDAQTFLPDWLRPSNAQEMAQMRQNMDMLNRMVREWEQDAFQDQAYAIHHYQNETGVNRYMNARQLAGYLAQVELEDHQSPDRERMRFSSYARAEHRFAADYDAFNAHLEDHMQDYVIKLPPGAEDAEDVDVLDDVLLLSEGGRGGGLPGAGDAADAADALSAGAGGPAGVDRWLLGVLPGGAEGSADAALVEDLLVEDAEDDLEAAAG